jgi:outer membrane receptor protein involved in Fe transport
MEQPAFSHMVSACLALAVCSALSLQCNAVAAGLVATEPREVTLNLPAGPLDDALKALALHSHVQILYAPNLVEPLRAPALRGSLTPRQALDRLLRGSGLRAVAVSPDTFVVERVPSVAPTTRTKRAPRAPQPRTNPVDMATVEVTGSRIPLSDIGAVTASPMTLITAEEIEASGYQTLFELLRLQPGMTSHHPVSVAADGRQGSQQPFTVAATTSLSALGPRATLFLVDGRRTANYGLTSSELGGLTDLDAIPLSMVERIEIVRGGASAIYGADAMAGVVNIILRKRQTGSVALARYGRSWRNDAGEQRVSLSHGFETAQGGNVLLGVDWLDRDGLAGDARDWHTTDHGRHGLPDLRFPLGDRDENLDLVESRCAHAPSDIAQTCLFDPARYTSLQPASRRLSLYGHLGQPLASGIDLDFDLRVSDARQHLDNPPFHARVDLPDSHPDAFPDGYLDYAFFDIGPVRNRSHNFTLDSTVGLSGRWGHWEWNVALSHHQNTVTSRINGMVSNTAIEDAMTNGTYRFDGRANPQAVLDALSPPVTFRGKATLQQFTAGINGTWFELPGGPVRVAVGLDLGRNALRHEPDEALVENDLALGASRRPIDDHRYNSAFYAELGLPLAKRLQADVALRTDHRQGFGSKVSPKLGLKWAVHDTLTLRGTLATGYRAPSLFELRRPNVIEEPVLVRVDDALLPCAFEVPLRDGLRGCILMFGAAENPDLRPETSRSHTLGLVWTPGTGFSLSLDHFRIRRGSEILPGSAFDDLEAFPDSLVRNENDELVGINSYFENVAHTDVRGWEAELHYRLSTTRSGDYSMRVSAQKLDRLERRAWDGALTYDHAGHGAPDRSLLASLQWSKGDWVTTLNMRARGSWLVGTLADGCPEHNIRAGRCRTPGTGTLDIDLAYNGIKDWRLGLNVRDIMDRAPVSYDIDMAGYDISHDDARGRYILLSARHGF